jgi:hypothetical protein
MVFSPGLLSNFNLSAVAGAVQKKQVFDAIVIG